MKNANKKARRPAAFNWPVLVAGLLLTYFVQQQAKEAGIFPDPTLMHVGWVIFFATMGLAYTGSYRGLMRAMATGGVCLVIGMWYSYRDQHISQPSPGVQIIQHRR